MKKSGEIQLLQPLTNLLFFSTLLSSLSLCIAGAFDKVVDDGKPLRRAAFQTLQTLLEVTPHRIDLPEFIAAIKQGIFDEEDIQMLTYQIFIELAKAHGSALLEMIDQLPKLIMDAVKKYINQVRR